MESDKAYKTYRAFTMQYASHFQSHLPQKLPAGLPPSMSQSTISTCRKLFFIKVLCFERLSSETWRIKFGKNFWRLLFSEFKPTFSEYYLMILSHQRFSGAVFIEKIGISTFPTEASLTELAKKFHLGMTFLDIQIHSSLKRRAKILQSRSKSAGVCSWSIIQKPRQLSS